MYSSFCQHNPIQHNITLHYTTLHTHTDRHTHTQTQRLTQTGKHTDTDKTETNVTTCHFEQFLCPTRRNVQFSAGFLSPRAPETVKRRRANTSAEGRTSSGTLPIGDFASPSLISKGVGGFEHYMSLS